MFSGRLASRPDAPAIPLTRPGAAPAAPQPHREGLRGTVAEAVVRTLVGHPAFGDGTGFHFLSGNTGSNEGPIWQAVQDVTGLRGLVHGATEFIAFCMASGFEARASAMGDAGPRRIPVLALHAQVGVKYGAAGLDFIVRQRQPCLLLVGDAGALARRHGGHNSVPDYRGMLAQLGVKSVHIPQEDAGPDALLPALTEAMGAAQSAPHGAVAVILDEDKLNAVTHLSPMAVGEPALPGDGPGAFEAGIDRAARRLAEAGQPLIVLNGEVGRASGARRAAERLAELVGAHVVACYAPGTIFARDHPAWCGNLGFGEADGVAQDIARHAPDAVLVVGGPFPNNVWPNGRSEIPDGVPAIVVSPEPSDRARCNIRAETVIEADVGIALGALCRAVDGQPRRVATTAAPARLDRIAATQRRARADRVTGYAARLEETPVHPARIARELALALRQRAEAGSLDLRRAAFFDEALTSSPPFLDYLLEADLHEIYYYATPGPTLGAHGAALGMQAAAPDDLVISLFGDGGADFNDAAFITAAREGLPVKFLLIDNGGYELVAANFARDARLRGESAAQQRAAGRVRPLHIQSPVHQNRAFQVRGFVSRQTGEPVFESAYVERPEGVRPAIEAMLDAAGPFLLQVIAQGAHFQPARAE